MRTTPTFRDRGDGVSKVTSKAPCRVCGEMTKMRLRGRAVCFNCLPPNANGEYYSRRPNNMAMLNSQALAVLTPTEMEKRVALAKFPQQLSATDKQMLVTVAIEYGLDPLMGELTVFQGRPYVSIDGRYRKAHETGQLEGVESRPASATEREIWEIPAGDFFFRAEVWKKGCAHPFVGWGRVRHAETEAPKSGAAGYRPLEVNPQRMAEKRAEAQALRKAFYLPLPSTEAPDDEGQPPQPGPQAAPEPPTPPKPPPQPSQAPPAPYQGQVEVKGTTAATLHHPLMPSDPDDWLGDGESTAAGPVSQAPEVGLRATLRDTLEKRWPGRADIRADFLADIVGKDCKTVEDVPAARLEEVIKKATPKERPKAKEA